MEEGQEEGQKEAHPDPMKRWAWEKPITIIVVIYLGNWTPTCTILVLFYFSGAKENVKPENVPVSLPFLFWFGQIFQGRSSKSGTSYKRNHNRRLREWGKGILFQGCPFIGGTEEFQLPEPREPPEGLLFMDIPFLSLPHAHPLLSHYQTFED